jgi:hypothetical protein
VNTAHLRSSTSTHGLTHDLTQGLSPEELAELAETAGDDLPPGLADLIKLMQGQNREVSPGDAKHIEGAFLGDFVIPRGDEQIVVRGPVGYSYVALGAECHWPEYLPARAGFVCPHDTKPPDTRWLKPNESPDGREGNYRQTNSNRIEETWYSHQLILPDDGSKPFVATYGFHGTACPIGKDMLRRASRKAQGQAVGNSVLVKWRMTSRPETGGGNRWFLPVPVIVGRHGEASGPTDDQVRLAIKLRSAFKQGLPIEADPPTPPMPPTLDQDAKPVVVATPRPMITSGRPIIRSVEEPPPHCAYDGPDDGGRDYSDEIPF